MYAILGSGLVGSLAYTFSDSFWFSAVEGEVYAMSSFFTAITFWCIMKWEREADQPRSSRWLVLIIGFLSILLVFSPENQSIQLVALIALLGTCCGALSTIVQKHLSKNFSEIQLMAWYSLGISFLSLPFCIYFWLRKIWVRASAFHVTT